MKVVVGPYKDPEVPVHIYLRQLSDGTIRLTVENDASMQDIAYIDFSEDQLYLNLKTCSLEAAEHLKLRLDPDGFIEVEKL